MTILDFNQSGELPLGEHKATMPQIQERFATNPIRTSQFNGLTKAVTALANAGCTTVWLDGSYVTQKAEPADYDAAFDANGIDWIELGVAEPELLDFDAPRSTQKRVYGGELIPNIEGGVDFVAFFQANRNGEPKGILRIDLTELS